MVRKYTGDEVPIEIIVNNPIVMDSGQRKASVLVLSQLYRLKLSSGGSDIEPADKIKLGETGAVKSDDGEFLALHPISDFDEYNYVNCFKLASGSAGETGPKGNTGYDGFSVEVYNDFVHRQIIFSRENSTAIIQFSEITGSAGTTGVTGEK